METSAKANINIEKAFCELAEAILDKTTGKDDRDNLDHRGGVRVGGKNLWHIFVKGLGFYINN